MKSRSIISRLPINVQFAGALGMAFIGSAAQSQNASPNNVTQIWINPGIYAQHFDRTKDLRNNNFGLGVEVVTSPKHAFLAGTYINSNRLRSHYAAYNWRAVHWQFNDLNIAAGMAIGLFDGYPNYHGGGLFLAPLPVFNVEGQRFGVNISIVPTIKNRLDGAVAFQFKLRI